MPNLTAMRRLIRAGNLIWINELVASRPSICRLWHGSLVCFDAVERDGLTHLWQHETDAVRYHLCFQTSLAHSDACAIDHFLDPLQMRSRPIRKIFFLAFFLSLSACEKQETNTTNRPLEDFKSVVENLKNSFNQRKPEVLAPGDIKFSTTWKKWHVYTTSNIDYDVVKTDSIVSPFSGSIDFDCNVRSVNGDSKEEAEKGVVIDQGGVKCKANYAFQENLWKFKSMSCRSALGEQQWELIPKEDSGLHGRCHAIAAQAAK